MLTGPLRPSENYRLLCLCFWSGAPKGDRDVKEIR